MSELTEQLASQFTPLQRDYMDARIQELLAPALESLAAARNSFDGIRLQITRDLAEMNARLAAIQAQE